MTQVVFNTFSEYFGSPTSNPEFNLVQKVKETYPDQELIALVDPGFPLSKFLQSQNIDVVINNKHRVHQFDYGQNKLNAAMRVGSTEFQFQGTDFLVYKFTWPELGMGQQTVYIVVHPSSDETGIRKGSVGEDLIAAAYKWNLDLKEEMWVFSDGQWMKDKKLWEAIQIADWNNLVLNTDFIAGLKRDTETFFSSREIYQSLGIPWKRGLLLLGPPGNGKTESIKVLLKESDHPCLYVKSFATNRGPENGIRTIFEFARRQAPCILVLEDLDSMVTPGVRSFFLNEIDGLEKNEGILTIATSNHPERIDDSILNRPSRFDVKYTFELPTYELRKSYINKWIVKIREFNGIEFKNELFVREMAEQTDRFSFAFLKELFVSFLLRTAHDKASGKPSGDPESDMKAQIKQLVAQIEKGEAAKQDTIGEGAREAHMPFPSLRPMRMMAGMPMTSGSMFGGSSGASGW